MLRNNNKQLLDKLISDSTIEELMWSNGYLSAILTQNTTTVSAANTASLVGAVTIIYATDTGNSKFIAGEFSKKLKSQSVKVRLKSSDQYRTSDLNKEQYAIFIISTHGDGDIPDSGAEFLKYITDNTPKLSNLNYLVIALGDSNYAHFCKAGEDVDTRLSALGAKRLIPRIDLDLDFEDHLSAIYEQIVSALTLNTNTLTTHSPSDNALTNKQGPTQYIGEIVSSTNLNDIGSSKETYHIEIVTDDALEYEPGDAIGIALQADDPDLNESFSTQVTGKLSPRLYSIASSLNEHGNEIHLTVVRVKGGICSNYLANLEVGQQIKFYIKKNRQFSLPDDDKDIIMIGAGTGIAPFRSFIAERNYRNSPGKNWLFFGDRNFSYDFLYQQEWLDYLNSELLSKLDVAFSRDQAEKIYVQHKLEECGKEVYQWLENGAYVYLCGSKNNLSQSIDTALCNIIGKYGDKKTIAAEKYLTELKKNGHYVKDVY